MSKIQPSTVQKYSSQKGNGLSAWCTVWTGSECRSLRRGHRTCCIAGLWGTREYASYKEVILGRFQVNDE